MPKGHVSFHVKQFNSNHTSRHGKKIIGNPNPDPNPNPNAATRVKFKLHLPDTN